MPHRLLVKAQVFSRLLRRLIKLVCTGIGNHAATHVRLRQAQELQRYIKLALHFSRRQRLVRSSMEGRTVAVEQKGDGGRITGSGGWRQPSPRAPLAKSRPASLRLSAARALSRQHTPVQASAEATIHGDAPPLISESLQKPVLRSHVHGYVPVNITPSPLNSRKTAAC